MCVYSGTYNGHEDNGLQVGQFNVDEPQQDDQGLVEKGSQTEEQDPSTDHSWVSHQVRCVRKCVDDVLPFIINAIHSTSSDSCHSQTKHCQHL